MNDVDLIDMNPVDLMKVADLAVQLGRILGMTPVWKKEYVIYGGNLDDAYIMCLSLDNGRWEILTGIERVLNLSQEAIALMAEMSKLVNGKEDDLGEKHNDEMD